MSMTPGELIAKYIEIRDYMKAESDAFDMRMEPYKESLTAIEGAIAIMLDEQGLDNFKAEAGTAYKTQVMSAKVSNRDAFIDYVFKNTAYDLLTANVTKEAVKDFMAAHDNSPPPGVDVTIIHKVNFRRS